MAQKRVYVDKTEVLFFVPAKNKIVRHSLTASNIVRIQFDNTTTKILGFIKSETETITVVSGKLASPIVYKRNENKKYFNEYKRELENFAKQNYVTFIDNIKESAE